MLMEMAEKELPFEEKIRVLYSISRSMKFMKKNFHGTSYDQIEQKCFATIQQEIFKASNVNQVKKYKIAENQVKVSLPVRVNWGGGWTDTPPYCNEKGGVAHNLNKTVGSISTTRAQLISKGIIYPVRYKELDFTVPEFSGYIQRLEEYKQWCISK